MTVTLIDLDPNVTPVAVTISRGDGSGLDHNGNLSAGQFGITSSPPAYFDTAGATSGEAAMLGYDGSVGRWYLHTGEVADQPHLMLPLRQAARDVPCLHGIIEVGCASVPARRSLRIVPGSAVGCVGAPARPQAPVA